QRVARRDPDFARSRIERLRESPILVAPVSVENPHLGRSRIEAARDGGVRLGRQLIASIAILRGVVVGMVALIPVIYPGQAFHIRAYPDDHLRGVSLPFSAQR